MNLDFLLFSILLISTIVLAAYSIRTKSKKYFVYMRISFFLMLIVFVFLMIRLKNILI